VLIRFEVSNFRSILHPVELSMVAVDRDRPEARSVASLGESLVPVAAIYGPNASGKSNVLAALSWLRSAVQDSLVYWDDGIPVDPFAFAENSGPLGFTIESVISGVRFEYVVELDSQAVHYEGLFHYPEKKRRRIFEREGNELTLQRGLGNLSGTRELLTARTLVLTIARRFDEPVVSDFARHLLDTQVLGRYTYPQRPLRLPRVRHPRDYDPRDVSTHRLFPESPLSVEGTLFELVDDLSDVEDPAEADRKQALALLRMADLGIEDVVIERRGRRTPTVRLVHRAGDGEGSLDFSSESDGTRTWFELIGPVLSALREGSLILFDELDASLHPTLSMHLIRLFHAPETNPKGAQLIFTSHDTSLLNHLNRDEVWLTEKLDDGATRLGALAEFAGERVRKSQNLEKAYLHGRFGALPDVDRTEILRALGLIG
jgi:energy-coupling factor transporter ATP-binding protein EcfA2